MMKVRNILIFVVTFIFGCMSAQERVGSQLGIEVGGGFHTMRFEPELGEQTDGFGGKIGVDYLGFFHKNIGLGIGLYANLYHSKFDINSSIPDTVVYVDELNYGYLFEKRRHLSMQELERSLLLEVPVSLAFKFGKKKAHFRMEMGALVALPVFFSYKTTGVYDIRGYYPDLNIEFYNLPDRFPSGEYEKTGKMDLAKWNISLFSELGFDRDITDKLGLYFAAYASYGLTNGVEVNEQHSFYNFDEDMQSHNVFAPDFVNRMRYFTLGLKLGLQVNWMKVKKHPLELGHLSNDTIPLLQIMIEDTVVVDTITMDTVLIDSLPKDTVVMDSVMVEEVKPEKKESAIKSRVTVKKNAPNQLDVRKKTVTLLCTNGKKLKLTFFIPGNEFVDPIMKKELNNLSKSLNAHPQDKVFLVGEEQNMKNLDQRVLRNDRVLLTYLKKLLMENGVRSDQILIGTGK